MENHVAPDDSPHTPPASAAEAHELLERIDRDSAALAAGPALPRWVHGTLGIGAAMLVGAPLAHDALFGFGALAMILLAPLVALVPQAIGGRIQGFTWPRPGGPRSRSVLTRGIGIVAMLLLASSMLSLAWEDAPWPVFAALAVAAGAAAVSSSRGYHEAVRDELAELGAPTAADEA